MIAFDLSPDNPCFGLGARRVAAYIGGMSIHIIKLVVGVSTLAEFAEIQKHYVVEFEGRPANTVWTRHMPKQAEELIEAGSIYRVIKNQIVARQKIMGFETVEHPIKGKMCLILTDTDLIATVPTPKRAFQGWRYLKPADAPADLGLYDSEDDLPPEDLRDDLAAAGLL